MGAHNGGPRAAAHGGWTVRVEVLALSARNGQIHFRHFNSVVPPSTPPHEVALALTDAPGDDHALLCHSRRGARRRLTAWS